MEEGGGGGAHRRRGASPAAAATRIGGRAAEFRKRRGGGRGEEERMAIWRFFQGGFCKMDGDARGRGGVRWTAGRWAAWDPRDLGRPFPRRPPLSRFGNF